MASPCRLDWPAEIPFMEPLLQIGAQPSSTKRNHGEDTMNLGNQRRGILKLMGLSAGVTIATLLGLLSGGLPVLMADELNLGMISGSPSKMIKRFTPLNDYLRSKGLPMGKIIGAQSLDEMISLIKEKKVDLVFESPSGAIQIMGATGAVPVLIREKDGIRRYNSVIFVNASSSIDSLDDLRGRVVVFEDPESTSAYILPKNILRSAGLELFESTRAVPGKVAYYFSRGDKNVLAHVKLGRADAGGIDKEAVAKLSQFRILPPESGYVPRHVLLVRDGIDYGLLKETLLNMAADPAASDILTKVETPTGFSAFEGDPRKIMDEVKANLSP
jgi:phosphonate transport system substrate-binding protein